MEGSASSLPYETGFFDLVYCVNAFHHFPDKRGFLSEARKVLKPGGVLAIIGMEPREVLPGEWWLYEYFECARARDLERFPSYEDVVAWAKDAGLAGSERKLVHLIESTIEGRGMLEHHFLKKGGTSQLALMSDNEYECGLDKIRRAISEAERSGRQCVFRAHIRQYMITSVKTDSL